MGDANATLSALTERLYTTAALTVARTVTLQAPSVYAPSPAVTRCFDIADDFGGIGGSEVININPGAVPINGSASPLSISTQYGSVTLCANRLTNTFTIKAMN